MENNGPTQPIEDDDSATQPGTQVIQDEDNEEAEKPTKPKEEEKSAVSRVLFDDDNDKESKEDLSFASKKELSPVEQEKRQKEVDETLQAVNPETLTDSFDIKKMKEVLEEFHSDQYELLKQVKQLPEDEGDLQLIDLASKAIQEQKPVHFVMNFLREISNDSLLLSFLKQKITVLIKLFSVATLKGDSAEDFYENWVAMENVFALVYPSATMQKIHLKFLEYIQNIFPVLVERFFDLFDFDQSHVPPKGTLRYIYSVCRDIYFVYAKPKQQLKTALFLIQKLQPDILLDLNSNNNINQRFDPVEWRTLKHLFGLCGTVLQKQLAADESFGIYQLIEAPKNPKKTKRDPGEDDDTNPKKEKNPKIQKFFLRKEMDASQTWILKIDQDKKCESLVREDQHQNEIDTYCSHVHNVNVLKNYLMTWKPNQKLCPVCQNTK